MALPASGAISLNQVNVELGNSGTANINMNSAAVRGLFDIASGAISMSDGYGKSSETVLTNEGTINGQANRKQITVSNFIDAGGTLVVPSGFWVWSDDTAVAAIIIDIACTLRNEGKVIGKGGAGKPNGATPAGGAGNPGGSAIKINSGVSGVTIINTSGSYIAGGGGGGGEAAAGGAGGAGGGDGTYDSVEGGVLNAVGDTYANFSSRGEGGGAGGGGGGSYYIAPYQYPGYGGGGGRILPGSGGAGGSAGGGQGGSAGDAGANGTASGSPTMYGAGGGGGWGAAGGTGSYGRAGGLAGKAINDSGVSYTLSNSGTIYGAT